MEFIKFLCKISWKNILIATIAGLLGGCGNALMISVINREVHDGRSTNAIFYFIALAVFILITSLLSQFMLIYLSQNAIYELRLQLSQNILSSPLEHLEKLRENRLIVMLTDDINQLTNTVSAIPNICIDLATVVGCFIYLALVSNVVFVVAITSTVMAITFVQSKMNRTQRLFVDAREEQDTLFKSFKDIMAGTKELKLNRSTRKAFISQKLKKSAERLRKKNTKALGSFALANGFGQMSQLFCLAIILFILPLLIDLPLSVLATYVLIGTFMALPMQNLLNRIPELMRGNVALKKIQRMKLSLIKLAEIETISPTICQTCHLQLRQIMYRYHPDFPHPFPHGVPPDNFSPLPPPFPPEHFPDMAHDLPKPPFQPHPPHHLKGKAFPPSEDPGFQLGPITLSIQSGELLFIVGGNGSGKSTLAKLITGLYLPQAGEIYLNQQLITEQNIEWYRQHFSAIFSDFYLFDSYLGFDYSNFDQKAEYYLKKLQLSHKVTIKDGILSTTNLSQGQRKRLALLTAYLEDRPIYLFDEWAADQDPTFRELFYTEIIMQLKEQGKMVIVITHDDRYFHLADHILKLNYGKLEFEETSLFSSGSEFFSNESI